MTVIAHLSDLHLSGVAFPARPLDGLKPVLGWINWARQPHALEPERRTATLAAAAALRPDHIAFTGDLIELGQPGELGPARAALDDLARLAPLSFAPGNHDFYARRAVRRVAQALGPHLPPEAAADPRGAYPTLHEIGVVALITLCSGAPTWLFSAEGELGAPQIARLAAILGRVDRARLMPVVALHHPPMAAGVPRLKRLRDADALITLLAAHDAPLVLHGHLHRAALTTIERDGRTISAWGAASASAAGEGAGGRAGFNRVAVDRFGGGFEWSVTPIAT